jgi:serine/threonine-protein kinase SRPK3
MYLPKRWIMNPLRVIQSRPWPETTAVPVLLDDVKPVEEEKTPYYDPKRLYPARLGEILDDRYQLATKLGYGTSSTVWLTRDLCQLRSFSYFGISSILNKSRWRWSPERYVAIKITAANRPEQQNAEVELQISKIILETNSYHPFGNSESCPNVAL